ncbi:hypothetical protein [Zavarzinia sp. CC-PAN008]|uniref:hypothetical protein n=1 Tax=Zavarzinia sp. CC-PAN008 TaxID=3243332 RepID=UPI003F749B63
MVTRIDRTVLVVPDRAQAAARWQTLLEAQPEWEDRSALLQARRTRLRLGEGLVELLEPDGTGPVDDALRARGAHLFAAGIATPDPAALAAGMAARGVAAVAEHEQLHLSPQALGIPGLRLVVSAEVERPAVGLVDFLYEATLLTADVDGAVARLVDVLGLDPAPHVPIASDTFGYRGVLTLFRPRILHRFEVIDPWKPGTTMRRFFERHGHSLYMAFGEAAAIATIEERVRTAEQGLTVDRPDGRDPGLPPDQLWLHPPALGGMMLGISRPSMAWSWSGSPERVMPLAASSDA